MATASDAIDDASLCNLRALHALARHLITDYDRDLDRLAELLSRDTADAAQREVA